jgi:hypothetical protein
MSSQFSNSHPNLRYFCMFVGYPKSGHSLVGSLLDAHPHIVIAHEQNVLQCVRLGFPLETIYGLLLNNSENFARRGRRWNRYTYLVPGQWNGRVKDLRVIGDKKGGGTTKLLKRHPELLEKFQQLIPLQHKFVHVTRNPFDSMTTLSKVDRRGMDRIIRHFFHKWEIVSRLREQIPGESWFDLRHESFIRDPKGGLETLCRFLGQEAPRDYLADCAAIVNPVPHKSRLDFPWTGDFIKDVEEKMKSVPFLEGYSYES